MEKKEPLKPENKIDEVEPPSEAVLIDLKQMNERIDHMSIEELTYLLKQHSLNPKGEINTLRETLKNSYKTLTLSNTRLSVAPNLFSYYVVIDFEATCEEPTPPNFRPEIIEFSAVLVSSKAQKAIGYFQMYCKPQKNPVLSNFCTRLTGITQDLVDSAEIFEEVLCCFHSWLKTHNVKRFAIVTDGPWDLARYLFNQCYYSNIEFPKWGRRWINLKTVFRNFYQNHFSGYDILSLDTMLKYLNLEFIGRRHCGLDDAKNIARVLLILIYNGANIQLNEKILTFSRSGKKNQGYNGNKKGGGEYSFKQNISHKMDKKNMMRAQFSAIRYNQPMPTYIKCRKNKQKAQFDMAMKISNNSLQAENQSDSFVKN